MKSSLSLSLVPCLVLLLGNSVFSRNSQSNVHKFSVYDDAPYCNGVICSSNEFCNRTATTPLCVEKIELDRPCTATGQCKTSNGECLGVAPSMSCKCTDEFVKSSDQCVPKCSSSSSIPTGECSTFHGFFCNLEIKGCLPQVDLNQPCTEKAGPDQCKTNNATCSEATCNCGTLFAEKDRECIPRCPLNSCNDIQFCDAPSGLCIPKSYLGEVCETTPQCLQGNSTCSSLKVCECDANFIEYYGSCLQSCAVNNDCKGDQYCDKANKICTNKAALNQGCVEEADDPCLDKNSTCSPTDPGRQPTCECKLDFAEKDGQCIESCTNVSCPPEEFCSSLTKLCGPRLSLGEICSAGNECAGEFSECNGEPLRCRCKFPDYVQAGDTCVKNCSSNLDCADLNSYCNLDFGMCNPKILLNGICNIKNSDQCKTINAACQVVGAMSTCSCNATYVEELATSTCVEKCTDNADCDIEKYCDISKGTCNNKIELQRECSKEDTDPCKPSNSMCTTFNATVSQCKCKQDFTQRDNDCVPSCKSSSDCNGDEEYCETASGLCQRKVELNKGCSENEQCLRPNAVCKGETDSKRCICNDTFVQWSSICIQRCTMSNEKTVCNNTEYCQEKDGFCYKKVGLHRVCSDAKQCSSPSAVCKRLSAASSSQTCECNDTTVEKENSCTAKCSRSDGCNFALEYCDDISTLCRNKVSLNNGCTEDGSEQCFGPLTTCKLAPSSTQNRACQCIQGAIESVDAIRCLLEASAIEDSCEEPQQCKNLDNGVPESVTCLDQKCQCQSSFVKSADSKRCLKVASVVEDSCEEPQQCKNLDNGVADSVTCLNKKCQCQSSFLKSYDAKRCLKKASAIQDSCEELQQCNDLNNGVAESVTCLDKKCQCRWSFLESADAKRCLKSARALGDTCEEPLQCFNLGNGANGGAETTTCNSENKCDCKLASTVIKADGRCYLRKLIGNSCASDKECTVGINGPVVCDPNSKACTCTSNSDVSVDKLTCVAKSDDDSGASLQINIFLLVSSLTFLKYWL